MLSFLWACVFQVTFLIFDNFQRNVTNAVGRENILTLGLKPLKNKHLKSNGQH